MAFSISKREQKNIETIVEEFKVILPEVIQTYITLGQEYIQNRYPDKNQIYLEKGDYKIVLELVRKSYQERKNNAQK